jgi:formate hydrogenlyase transcriptional activator
VSMQLVASSHPAPDDDLPQFERLVASLSSTFASLQFEELSPAVLHTLDQVCLTLNVDSSSLIAFDDDAGVKTCVSRSRPGIRTPGDDANIDAAAWTWTRGRLADGLSLPISRLEDLPMEAREEREYARRAGLPTSLSVPVSFNGRLLCALMVASAQRYREWPAAFQDRVRLIAQIIGTALQRARQESALRASLDEIKRLNSRLAADNVCLQEEIKTFHDFDEIVGDSVVMRNALERLTQVAPLNCAVLLLGETGTGKELFARAVHDRSRRRSRALIRVNCAALPPSLIESELFGHEKGAFTGAVGLRQGRFELADGGTVFLDEIGDLPLDMQGKLLRVLQEGEFERVGSSRTRKVDVRVIAATHHDLDTAVAEGAFRADLFYRLSVYPIPVPPLRERPGDIPSLVWFFIHHHQRELGRRIEKVPNSVMSLLQAHDWPGNVRELQNVVERALIRSSGDTLQLDGAFSERPRARPTGPATLDEVQRGHIEDTLRQCGWRINGVGNAAERLGLHPNTLRFRMKKLGITSPSKRRAEAMGL